MHQRPTTLPTRAKPAPSQQSRTHKQGTLLRSHAPHIPFPALPTSLHHHSLRVTREVPRSLAPVCGSLSCDKGRGLKGASSVLRMRPGVGAPDSTTEQARSKSKVAEACSERSPGTSESKSFVADTPTAAEQGEAGPMLRDRRPSGPPCCWPRGTLLLLLAAAALAQYATQVGHGNEASKDGMGDEALGRPRAPPSQHSAVDNTTLPVAC